MKKAKYNFCVFETRLDSGAFYCENAICESVEEVEAHEADYNCKLTEAYPLIVRGKTWKEKKAFLHQLALDISYAECGGLSWGEEAILGDFFERYGKRFGLLREFRENGIC